MSKWNQSILPKQWPWPRADQCDWSSSCTSANKTCWQSMEHNIRQPMASGNLMDDCRTLWYKSILTPYLYDYLLSYYIYIYMWVYITIYKINIYIYSYIILHTSPKPTLLLLCYVSGSKILRPWQWISIALSGPLQHHCRRPHVAACNPQCQAAMSSATSAL